MARSLSLPSLLRLVATLALAGPASAQLVFEPPVASMAVEFAQSGVLGDLNEDGYLDAVTSSLPMGPQPALSLGQADGSFGPPQTLTAFAGGAAIFRLADFDGDGHLDALLWTNLPGVGSIAVAPGDGQGGFGAMVALNVAAEMAGVADAGDFDADGDLDVAIFNRPTQLVPASVLAVFGHGDGSFDPAIPLATITYPELVGQGANIVRVGDTDGDGLDDLVLSADIGNGVLRSLGDGRFVPVECAGGCVHAVGGVLADLNADGRQDVVETSRLLIAQPDGSLQLGQSLPLGSMQVGVDAADFDGDGHVDVALSRSNGILGPPGSVLLLRGLGDGSVQSTGLVVNSVTGDLSFVEAGDIDGDGRADLAVVGSAMGLHLARLTALINYTYAPGSPFLDLGGSSSNSWGSPIQLASGTLVAGQPFAFKLVNGPPTGSAWHVIGFAALQAPFKNGTMVPVPSLLNGPFPVTGAGQVTLAGNWPAGGSGVALYLQYWTTTPPGFPPVQFSASSGVRAQIP